MLFGKFHRGGGRGGVQLLKAKPGPKPQSIRTGHPPRNSPKLQRHENCPKTVHKRKRNFLDLPRSSSIFPRSSSIFTRSFLDLPLSSSSFLDLFVLPRSSSIFLDFPRCSSIFLDLHPIFPRSSPDLSSILKSARWVSKGVITVLDPQRNLAVLSAGVLDQKTVQHGPDDRFGRNSHCILNYYPAHSKTIWWGNSEITPLEINSH